MTKELWFKMGFGSAVTCSEPGTNVTSLAQLVLEVNDGASFCGFAEALWIEEFAACPDPNGCNPMPGVDLKSAEMYVPEGDRVQLTASGSVTIWTTESEPVAGGVETTTIQGAGAALLVKEPSSRPRAEPCADTHDPGR